MLEASLNIGKIKEIPIPSKIAARKLVNGTNIISFQ